MAAQGYQESTLDHAVRSPVGAIGVMQVMPPTGKELNVGDITEIEPNIHAGVKYMRFMMDQYFKDEPMDALNKGLMTFAAYNAGPGRLQTAAARGGGERPRSQRVVRQRRACRLGADWPRNRHLRQQHLQVLHHLSSALRSTRAPRSGEGECREKEANHEHSSSRPASVFTAFARPARRQSSARPEDLSRVAQTPAQLVRLRMAASTASPESVLRKNAAQPAASARARVSGSS